ncbi:MAG TPA: hypothetical protein PLZ93_01040 [Nocardioides sp.]|jgi:hypothetical protein|uniref:hypothetical protein n=1 Tax=uncultured Nocardioides sp. TaxID=198441 RepID=UPI001D214A56|nr:hypothetical protein [uncultured Nocardioides sp.]MCB0908673.1 hypothetical protein [Nocardioidaceae bacterium]HRD59303.1 hypothetical protein [Nocardioides sp.]HRI94177.1 hypothetical protein [Nocardioides sp.]HRK44280.1 hypothetical protein [Nocardioides sp.]
MNPYGTRMREHYAKHRATELAAIADPESFFEGLGLQIEAEIDTLADQIAGPSDPSEGYLERVGRLSEARISAESEVLRLHMTPGLASPPSL